MVKNAITVFARIKPEKSRNKIVNYDVHRRPKKHSNEDFLVLNGPQKFADYIDNRPESWNFSFHRIFEHDVNQDDVFESVARPVIDSVFEGYNATIFAYGQTGSGKTYSITGDPSMNSERGILPRTLQYIFQTVQKNSDSLYTVEIAYLEIYNENGYDLLMEREVRESAGRLEDLPRVTIQEDEEGTMHLKNLSFRIVGNEKEAMQFLVDGDAYRAISETPMNPRSSRSHCIFTIVVSVKKFGANRYTRAKMHLVDLAGSERVYKCAIQGTILTEAKHINLSLHYLEQVIVCLGQDNLSHVPYRNSLLTSVLRDSLGGNCLTTMLATLSVSSFNLEETISTCRFAQRVALVKNDVDLTFEIDTKSENTLLKLENDRLRRQIEELKNRDVSDIAIRRSVDYYKNLVVQRDQEISHLIDLLEKEKSRKKSSTSREISVATEELRQDEKSTQTPGSRFSRTSDQVSTTKSKTRRKNANSDEVKDQTSPESNSTESSEVTQRSLDSRTPRRTRSQVPDINLKENVYSLVSHDQELDQEGSETSKTESLECPNDRNIRTSKMSKFNIIDNNESPNKKEMETPLMNKKSPEIDNSTAKISRENNNKVRAIELPKVSTERQIEKTKITNSIANHLDDDNSTKDKKINEFPANKKFPEVDQVDLSITDGAEAGRPIESPKITIKKYAQINETEDEFSRSKEFENDNSKIIRPNEKAGTEREIPRKVMKMLRKSCNQSVDDRDEDITLAAESNEPRNDFKTSNVIRGNLLIKENPTGDEVSLVEDKRLSNPTKINGDGNGDNIVDMSSLLTGDPDIDEELIAFYRAKQEGRLY